MSLVARGREHFRGDLADFVLLNRDFLQKGGVLIHKNLLASYPMATGVISASSHAL